MTCRPAFLTPNQDERLAKEALADHMTDFYHGIGRTDWNSELYLSGYRLFTRSCTDGVLRLRLVPIINQEFATLGDEQVHFIDRATRTVIRRQPSQTRQ